MAVTAEVPQVDVGNEFFAESQLLTPLVINVAERETADRLPLGAMQYLGRASIDAETLAEETPNLMTGIHRAAEGDLIARQLVAANVRSDMIERTIKSGHVTEVNLEVDQFGRILQFGQTTEQIMANSFRYASQSWQMQERVAAEARNKFRIDRAHGEGLLDEYVFVVISRAADNMDEAQLADEGFFSDTMSLSLQVTTFNEGRITVESAFVAGKAEPEANRQDAAMVAYFAGQLGQDFSGKTATEVLDMPLLVHKSLMPNGVVDFVGIVDEYDGTFFGEARPRQDYTLYKHECEAREAGLAVRVEKVVNQLISEAATIDTPQKATARLGKLSALQMVEEAVIDERINPLVFGAPAAFRIEHARYAYQQGNVYQQELATQSAKIIEASRSCPGGGGESDAQGNETSPGNSKKKSSELDDCEFVSKKCPKCGAKDVKTTVKKGKYYGACGCVG